MRRCTTTQSIMIMKQLTLLNEDFGPSRETITNVASVPHRSPFRYPGGKTCLVPRIRNWLRSMEYHPRNFIEPFAGGAIIGLTVAFEGLAEHVTLVEIDSQVAAVWKIILSGEGPRLAKRILDFEPTEERVSEVLEVEVKTCKERAFIEGDGLETVSQNSSCRRDNIFVSRNTMPQHIQPWQSPVRKQVSDIIPQSPIGQPLSITGAARVVNCSRQDLSLGTNILISESSIELFIGSEILLRSNHAKKL